MSRASMPPPVWFREYRPRPGSTLVQACSLCGPEQKSGRIPACPFWAKRWVWDADVAARPSGQRRKLYLCDRHKRREQRARKLASP